MVSEFEFIRNLKKKYSLDKIGDDCAVLPKDSETDLLLTADMLVEDIDFRLEWTTPEFLGHKALAVSLSDIAAMGGLAVWSMVSIGVPEALWKTDFIDRIYEGWFALATAFDVELVGGDISKTPNKLVIDSIVGGEVKKGRAIMRSGARAGDSIFVTGTLGGAAGGLRMLEKGVRFDASDRNAKSDLILKQLQPQPQLIVAKSLNIQGIATSMIDLSDGFSSDLKHVCLESRVGAHIQADRLPIDPLLSTFFTAEECLDMALNGGEDLQLLFTVEQKNIQRLDPMLATEIGTIDSDDGILQFVNAVKSERLQPKGYRHF